MIAPPTLELVASRGKLSDQVRHAIKSSGMSRYAICKRLDFSESVMSRFMSGQCGLSLETLDRLGDLLGLELIARKSKSRSRK